MLCYARTLRRSAAKGNQPRQSLLCNGLEIGAGTWVLRQAKVILRIEGVEKALACLLVQILHVGVVCRQDMSLTPVATLRPTYILSSVKEASAVRLLSLGSVGCRIPPLIAPLDLTKLAVPTAILFTCHACKYCPLAFHGGMWRDLHPTGPREGSQSWCY